MIIDILKAFLIGVCASAPVGPIAILVIQKTLSKGRRAGFITSLGACLIDSLFATIAIFALAFAQNILNTHRELILILGGTIVGILGIVMTLSDPFRKLKSGENNSDLSIKDFIQAFIMGLSNPGAIFIILALFAFFGFSDKHPNNWSVAPLIISVCLGAITYWYLIVSLLNIFRKRFKLNTILWINRIAGTIIIIIGIGLLSEGIFKYFFF